MPEDQNKTDQQTEPVAQSEQVEHEKTEAPATPQPSSKLIPTRHSTLFWMLLVLIIGITIILWAGI